MGLRLRVSDHRSPGRGHRCCLQACTHPGQDPTVTKISELNTIHSRTATPGPFILVSFLCTLQPATSAKPPYTLAATLDTEPLARSYSGGIYPRLSSNHFQFARPPDCDANGVAICVPHVNLWSYIGAGRNATRSWQPLFQCVDLDHGVHDECTEHQAIESYQGYQGPDQNPDGSNRRPRNPERFSLVIADLSEQLTRFRVRSGSICHGDSEFLYASVPSRTTMFNRRRPKTLTVGVG